MLTRVVEEPRVSAAVKSAHMATLKSKFMPKKEARRPKSMILLSGAREKREASEAASVEVDCVVVLSGCVRHVFLSGGRRPHSFAKQPLMAAQAPLATARIIHTGCRRRKLLIVGVEVFLPLDCASLASSGAGMAGFLLRRGILAAVPVLVEETCRAAGE